ncbi:hypothetical protein HA402_000551 [Bradysia odoriphaga]|nr:hypothetical protein HA402_000551 [Bradysia odoriphaga]
MMRHFILGFGCIVLLGLIGEIHSARLQIKTTKQVECTTKSKHGDTLRIHYRGTLENGKEFDSSYQRGIPFVFKIGFGNVIKGWDQGLLDMCEGEKRRLTIPPELAYGEKGFEGFIKPGETIIFDTELLQINGRDEL